MATPQRVMPVLPADVWRIVFSDFEEDHDLTHLWIECRNVSKLFRDEVEHVFKTKHLPKISIAFDLGTTGSFDCLNVLADRISGSFYCNSDDAEQDEDNIFSSKNHVDLSGIQFDLDRFAHNERIAIYKLREGCVAKDIVCEVFERLPFAIPTLKATVSNPHARPQVVFRFNESPNQKNHCPLMLLQSVSMSHSYDCRPLH